MDAGPISHESSLKAIQPGLRMAIIRQRRIAELGVDNPVYAGWTKTNTSHGPACTLVESIIDVESVEGTVGRERPWFRHPDVNFNL